MTEKREIKFRGIPVNGIKEIRPDNSIGPIPFVYGGHCKVEGKHYIILDDAELFSSNVDGEMIYGFIEVIPESVGQYTGHHRKNVEFFDGDIIKSGHKGYDYIRRIGWNQAHGEWSTYRTLKDDTQWGHFDGAEAEVSEVIGNIHQNPEFMETK